MRFLFRLDLSLHAGAGKKFEILIFGTKHGVRMAGIASNEQVNAASANHPLLERKNKEPPSSGKNVLSARMLS